MQNVIIMGVAGCGKSSLAQAIARDGRFTLVEGDDLHSQFCRDKMKAGQALTDQDRVGWLTRIGQVLCEGDRPKVLTCSALRRIYRDQLRAAAPGLNFVFIDISIQAARDRLLARPNHFFPPALIDSQFATLESPVGEAGVLAVDAQKPIEQMLAQVNTWLANRELA
jgi:gluconokinase